MYERIRNGVFPNIVPTQRLINYNLDKVYVDMSREQFSVVEFSHSVIHNFIVTGQSTFVTIRYMLRKLCVWIQLFHETDDGKFKNVTVGLVPENCEEVIIIH